MKPCPSPWQSRKSLFLWRLLRVFWRYLIFFFFFFPFPCSVAFARHQGIDKAPILKRKSAQLHWIWEVRKGAGNYWVLFSCHGTKWKMFSISVSRSCYLRLFPVLASDSPCLGDPFFIFCSSGRICLLSEYSGMWLLCKSEDQDVVYGFEETQESVESEGRGIKRTRENYSWRTGAG